MIKLGALGVWGALAAGFGGCGERSLARDGRGAQENHVDAGARVDGEAPAEGILPGTDAGTPHDGASASASVTTDGGAAGNGCRAVPIEAPPALCIAGDRTWCWESPTPSTETYLAVGGTGRDDLWLLGSTTVLHFDGRTWSSTLEGGDFMWGGQFFTAAADDVWLAAGSGVWHFDGIVWAKQVAFLEGEGPFAMRGVWGSASDDVWAIGSSDNGWNPLLAHYDGAAWRLVTLPGVVPGIPGQAPSASYLAIGGTARDDVWALVHMGTNDRSATLFHFDGTAWARTSIVLDDVFSANNRFSSGGRADLWLGSSGGLQHWNGSTWQLVPLTGSIHPGTFIPVVLGPDDVFAVGDGGPLPSDVFHWDGVRWTWIATDVAPVSLPNFIAAGGWPSTGLLAVGFLGRIAQWACGTWRPVTRRIVDEGLNAVWAVSRDDVWAVGDRGTLLHDDGTGWIRATAPTNADLTTLWASGPRDVWAGGSGGNTLHFDGTSWTSVPTGSQEGIVGLAGSGPGDVWATTASQVLRFDGRAWSVARQTEGESYRSLTVIAADDVWISGGAPSPSSPPEWSSVLFHWDGARFTITVTPGGHFLDQLMGHAADDIWATASLNWLFHYDGHQWDTVLTGHRSTMNDRGPFLGSMAGNPGEMPTFIEGTAARPYDTVVQLDANQSLHEIPRPYVDIEYKGLFVLGRDIWLVGPNGTIQHGF